VQRQSSNGAKRLSWLERKENCVHQNQERKLTCLSGMVITPLRHYEEVHLPDHQRFKRHPKKRGTSLNVRLLQQATQTTAKDIATTSKIAAELDDRSEVHKLKEKIKSMKDDFAKKGEERREIGTAVVREAISKAAFEQGLSLRSAEMVIVCYFVHYYPNPLTFSDLPPSS